MGYEEINARYGRSVDQFRRHQLATAAVDAKAKVAGLDGFPINRRRHQLATAALRAVAAQDVPRGSARRSNLA